MSAFLSRLPELDHFVLVVRDLPKSKSSFEEHGFQMTPMGEHVGWGTANHLAVLQQQYIELWGSYGKGRDSEFVRSLAEEAEGLWQMGLKTADATADCARLRERGVAMEEPFDYARPIEIDGVETEVRFVICYFPGSRHHGIRFFLCEHVTPELIWRSEWQLHGNGATAVTEVEIGVDDPIAAADEIAKSLACERPDDAVLKLGSALVRFSQHQDATPALTLEIRAQSSQRGGAARIIMAREGSWGTEIRLRAGSLIGNVAAPR